MAREPSDERRRPYETTLYMTQHMTQRVRAALADREFHKLTGIAEINETWF